MLGPRETRLVRMDWVPFFSPSQPAYLIFISQSVLTPANTVQFIQMHCILIDLGPYLPSKILVFSRAAQAQKKTTPCAAGPATLA